MKFIPILITALVFLIMLFTIEYKTNFFEAKIEDLKTSKEEQKFLNYSQKALTDFESQGTEITAERLEDYQILQKRILENTENLSSASKKDLYKMLSDVNKQMLSFEGYEE